MAVEIRFAYQANCWGPLGGAAVGVTSVGQLTYLTFGDMSRAIAEIGAAGYQGVELFDGNVLDYPGGAAALKAALAQTGVRLVAAYSGANFIFPDILDQELGRIARAADAAAALSAEHLVVGGGAKRLEGVAPGDYERLAAGLEKVVAIAKARGLEAHYHPHLSTIVEGPAEVDRIFSLTSIHFCPDTAHLAAAGGDVPAMIRKHRDRIGYVHLKGLRMEPFAFTPLDEGDLDNAAVVGALAETNYSGWIAAELDAWPDPKGGAERSLAFMKRKLAAA
ncbi:MAG TPA: sugar phosphate isomerase/epimerase [Roseiarcus sp.]|jgi:inosose dehydratase|nr:sugar phosphate isomerase/epimerase [Roseiarcus sp.]